MAIKKPYTTTPVVPVKQIADTNPMGKVVVGPKNRSTPALQPQRIGQSPAFGRPAKLMPAAPATGHRLGQRKR